jgi:phosphoenolpyruvate carboxykinase (ATP)
MNAIHDGSLANTQFAKLPVFNVTYPTNIPGVDPKILNPENAWASKDEYKVYLRKVAEMFNKNFARFDKDASAAVKAGAPTVE